MSEAKFTKGEWVTCVNGQWSDCGSWSVDNDDASTFGYVAVNVGNATICLVVSDSWDDTEMESNAHLIAAAPEMYEAIDAALRIERLWTYDVCDEEHAAEAEALHSMRQKFIDALAKARGEA